MAARPKTKTLKKPGKRAKPAPPTRAARGAPRHKTVAIAPTLEQYAALVTSLDFLRGSVGQQRVSEEVQPLLEAFHQVLAGGRLATKKIRVRGSPDRNTVRELDKLVQSALAEANQNNGRRPHVMFG